uniref:ubiquitinyl hydrolase 1 n=1 Tax=Strigamia maritima TaxID=126957 RepID=T1J592_STRMM
MEINTENPLGTGGKLATSFATLMRTLWSGSHKSYSPSKLKNLISLKANQFTGFLQHDAQEFMAFLLDGLHEDLNRIKTKPYMQTCPDADNRPDAVIANEAWQLYKKRNDSIVVDLFQGQYKSKLVCPVCAKVSITFDPFLYLSVPLPKTQRLFPITFFAKDPSRRPIKFYLRLSQNAIANELFNELSKLTSVPTSCLRIFEVARNKISRFLSRGSNIETINENTPVFAFEVLDEDLIGESVVEYTILQRVKMPLPVTRCSCCKHEAPPDTKLKRCTNCYRVGYCDQSCQRNHWTTHKTNCKFQPELIGLPFLISMPRSQATYRKLCYMIEAFACYSVDVFQPPIKLKEPLGNCKSTSTVTSATITETAATTEPVAEALKEAVTYTRAVVGQMEKLGERLAQPFSICCVNQSGQTVCMERDTVEDLGEEPLDLPSKFLAVDWNNNEKMKNFVLVQSKPLEVDMDEDDCNATRDARANITLEQCLQLFTEPEELTPDEAWYCPRCKEHREATKQMSLWRLPPILIVQLKRFSFKNLILRDKIDKTVEFPTRHLDLTPYHCGPLEADNQPPIYDLYAVINHHGTILGGHYTAFARLVSQNNTRRSDVDWRLFDDSRVSFVDESRVMTTAGYVLFYRRRGAVYKVAVRCDEAITANAVEGTEDEVEKSTLKLESGDFERPLMYTGMEAVD